MNNAALPIALALLLIAPMVSPTEVSSGTTPPTSLSRVETEICRKRRGDCVIVQRENIILVWPRAWKPAWYGESKAQTPDDLADYLELAYRLMARWTNHDPNAHYAERNKERARLIFIYSGDSDFVFGGARPYIGLRDGTNPVAGTEDWFGWLAHEMSHDFWHEHPVFQKVKEPWGEAMCDYSRYYILLNCGMPEAAFRWRAVCESAAPTDRYRGGATVLLRYDHDHRLDGPAGLWLHLRDKQFDDALGPPPWGK
jgi:hypothetical protein